MASLVLLSTLLMGLFLLAIAVTITRLRDWRRVTPSVEGGTDLLGRVARSPLAWTAVFAVVTFAFGLGAILAVGGFSVPAWTGDFWAVFPAMLAPFGLLLVGFLSVGLYSAARSRGLGNALAVMIATATVALVLVVFIAARLLFL